MSVFTKFTNGVGNNLFQYFYGKILSEKLDCNHFHPELPLLNVNQNAPSAISLLNKITAKKIYTNWFDEMSNAVKSKSYVIDGYPEDYSIFLGHKDQLSKFIRNNVQKCDYFDGVVIHLRLGDRLFRKSDYLPGMKLDLNQLGILLDSLSSKKLKVVSDLNLWKIIDKNDLNKISSHVSVHHSKRQHDTEIVKHLNSIYKFFEERNAIFDESSTIKEDFSQMLNSRYLIFQHGTLAWWAGFSGHQEKVFVADGWRPIKGINNKNLDKTPLYNWHNW